MIKLPRTIGDLLSPEGQAAIERAEQVLNAIANAQIIVVTTDGVEHRASLEIGKAAAIARVVL